MARHYFQLSTVLQHLLYVHHMNSNQLARSVSLPAPTVHRLVSGKSTRPYKSSLKPIADYFGITMEQLLGEEPIERSQDPQGQVTFSTTRHIIELPLIEWEHLRHSNTRKKYEQTVIATNNVSPKCFAVSMQDDSMKPKFLQGCTLILDPFKIPDDRNFVLVQSNHDNGVVFRQLIYDAETKVLKTFNPLLNEYQFIALEEDDNILGVLVEARQRY